MTVIAYRDGVMAGDSCWSDGGDGTFCGNVESLKDKLLRLKSGALYGGSGACDDRALVAKLQNAKTVSGLPSSKWLAECEHSGVKALVVLPDETVWHIVTGEDQGGVMPVEMKYTAVGCGAQIAIGAMWYGADAYNAVQAACDHNVYCKPPITYLGLK